MRHKLALIIVNTGLLAVVVALLSGPLLLGQLLGGSQSGSLGVSQVAPTARQLMVYPNTTDFSQYATFNPSPLTESLFYQTSVTFSTFADQQAVYNGLFTLYNPGTTPLTIKVETGNLSGQVEGSQVWVSLSPADHSAVTLITEPALAGASELVVADASAFASGSIFIGDKTLSATLQSATRVRLTTPLSESVAVGDKVYLGAAFYNNQLQPTSGATHSITVPAEGRAAVSLTVATSGGDGQEQIVLPITILAE